MNLSSPPHVGGNVSIGLARKHITSSSPSNSTLPLYASKIGGRPTWWDERTAPTALVCNACHSSDAMVMLAQLYAPIDFNRSLYVFCCNRRECSLSNAGWVVVRNQDGAQRQPNTPLSPRYCRSASTTSRRRRQEACALHQRTGECHQGVRMGFVGVGDRRGDWRRR